MQHFDKPVSGTADTVRAVSASVPAYVKNKKSANLLIKKNRKMKQNKWGVLAMALLFPALTAIADSRNVVVQQPGTLSQAVTAGQLDGVTSLSIEGTLNAKDFEIIRQLATTHGGKGGKLKNLNLSRARIDTGYNIYEVPDSLFAGCDALVTLKMPADLFSVGYDSFVGCTSLKKIMCLNFTYIPYALFRDLPSLETVSITGHVVHADGTPFQNLPNLRSVTFGTMGRTGGPLVAENCPRLKKVVFRGLLLDVNFEKLEGCPLIKKCRVSGYIGYDRSEVFAGKSLEQGGMAVADSVMHFLRQGLGHPSRFVREECASVAYNVGSLYSLKNDTANALRMLDLSFELNPLETEYSHLQEDTDLDNVRHTAHFARYADSVRHHTDYLLVLRNSHAYATGTETSGKRFTYAPASDASMERIRDYFNLDSIAGNGDEVSRIKNVMYWLHDEIRHDGSSGIPRVPRTAIDLYKVCKEGNRGMNCRGLAIVLSELYLAMGCPARFVTCQPKAYDTDHDCHVICMVWSRQLNKWLWMDPSFAAYVSDENGNLLGIAEVRERLRDGRPLVLNDDANWNHRSKQTKERYLDRYMAKNLYYLSTYLESCAETENGTRDDVTLQPEGDNARINSVKTWDDAWFWQTPDAQ